MHVERHRDDYIETLRRLDGADSWNAWIAFFLHALTEQAEVNATTARRIVDRYERLKAEVLDLTHSRFAVPLLDRCCCWGNSGRPGCSRS